MIEGKWLLKVQLERLINEMENARGSIAMFDIIATMDDYLLDYVDSQEITSLVETIRGRKFQRRPWIA